MKREKSGLGYAKVQALYLLKIHAGENINHLAVIKRRFDISKALYLIGYPVIESKF